MRKTLLLILILIFLPVGVLADECKSENHPWQRARGAGFFGPAYAAPTREVVTPDSDNDPTTPEFYAAWPKGTDFTKLYNSFMAGCRNLDCPDGEECACENMGSFYYDRVRYSPSTNRYVDQYYVIIDCQCVGECSVPGPDIMGQDKEGSNF